MKKITIETLKDLNACPEAIREARKDKRIAKGVTPAVFLKSIPRSDWLIWWLWNSKQATIEQCILLGCVAGRRSLRFARKEDKEVLVRAFDAAEAVAENNTEETRSAASAAWSAAWIAAWIAARSAAWSAARNAAWSAESAANAARNAAWSAARSAAWSAESAASAAWSAESAASAARSAGKSESAEHLACANAMRKCMRTKRYKSAGKNETKGDSI